MRVHPASRVVVAAAALAALPAFAADPGARRQAGSCAAFVKRVEAANRSGLARPDLYPGLSGWIAMKGGLHPDEVDGLAQDAAPDASSCGAFQLDVPALRALEALVAKPPADGVRDSAETCLAHLRLLEETDEGSRQAALRALDAAQARTVGRLLGFLAPWAKPAPMAVQARLQALRESAAGDPRGVALGPALSTCEPLGVNVAQLREAHGAGAGAAPRPQNG